MTSRRFFGSLRSSSRRRLGLADRDRAVLRGRCLVDVLGKLGDRQRVTGEGTAGVRNLARGDPVDERLERAASVAVPRQGGEDGQADVLRDVVDQVRSSGIAAEPPEAVPVGDHADPFEQVLDSSAAACLGGQREGSELRHGCLAGGDGHRLLATPRTDHGNSLARPGQGCASRAHRTAESVAEAGPQGRIRGGVAAPRPRSRDVAHQLEPAQMAGTGYDEGPALGASRRACRRDEPIVNRSVAVTVAVAAG